MRFLGIMAVAAIVATPVQAAEDDGSAKALSGLWQARKRFGPDVRGELQMRQDAKGWHAAIAGRAAEATLEGDWLVFTLPRGEGSFRGKRTSDGHIRGHWMQQPLATAGMAYTSPVALAPAGQGVWRGTVRPLDDGFTLYLKVTPQANGSTAAFLRNPERNIGLGANLRRLERQGDTVTLYGRPNGAKEDVEISAGAYDARADRLSLYLRWRGGSYDFTRVGEDSDFYPRPGAPHYAYRPPVPRDDGWRVGALDSAGLDRAAIERFVQMLIEQPIGDVHAPEIHGVLVARHGQLVLEEYLHGIDGNAPHETRSAAKSLTSMLVGAAIQDGAKVSADTPVYATMGVTPDDPRKRAMTLGHLLDMASGFHCDDRDPQAPGNEDVMQEQEAQRDWYRYALDLPMVAAPGAETVYCSTNPNLAGGVLARATGAPLEDSFERLIARPLQFGPYALDLQPTGEPYMGGGAQFRPRDFLKLGQVMLDGGMWQGQRILGADWVKRSAAVPRDLRGKRYGYLWWGLDLPWRGKTIPAYYAAGNGGQTLMVIPALDMVVAIFAGNYGDRVMLDTQERLVPQFVLPAVTK